MSVKQLTLPSGRSLDYLVQGSDAADAFPFLYIHGTPGAYPVMKTLATKCKQQNFKLISLSRPGYGGSTRHPGRKVVDIVDDISALVNHLGVKQCIVCGWSGGGPLSLACAARLPACIAAICVAGVAPWNVEGLDWLAGQGEDNVKETEASLKGEQALREVVEPQREELLQADADGIVKEMSSILPDVDKKAILENTDVGEETIASFQEALKHSVDGWVDDSLSFIAPWGFELSEIRRPVFLYQGSEDLMVPFGHGEWLAKNLPKEYLTEHLVEGEGHISIWLSYMDSMMDEASKARK